MDDLVMIARYSRLLMRLCRFPTKERNVQLTVLRNACAAMLAAGMLAASGATQNSAAPGDFGLELTGNFIARTSHWESSGAFSDEGIIKEDLRHEPNGNPSKVFNNLSVILTLEGGRGSFTYKFTRHWMPTPGDKPPFQMPDLRSYGDWQMVGGTGVYTGITGQGVFKGVWNYETGDFTDTLTGHVRLSPCNKDAGTGVEVCRL
jgi:hypothetical protein